MASGSPQQLAKRLGVTDRAVIKALSEGRIPGRKQGRIWILPDIEAAFLAWQDRDTRRAPPEPPPPPVEAVPPRAPRPPPPPAPAASPEPGHLGDEYGFQSFEESRAVSEFWKAKRAELDFRRATGQLVEIAEVQAAYNDEIATCRSKLLAVPSRFRQRVPMRPEDFRLLEELVREVLEELGSSVAGGAPS